MPEDIDWSVLTPNVKHRKCPGCGAELTRFRMTTLAMPIEQFAIPMLLSANEALDWSIRSFGHQSLLELQQLVFASNCDACTLISHWDFGTKEFAEILSVPEHPPFAQISWVYAPELIESKLALAPSWLKPQLENLLNTLRQNPKNDKT